MAERRMGIKKMQQLCGTDEITEFNTPAGGKLVYGSCKKHDFFIAMIHCPTTDVRAFAESLLEAVSNMESKQRSKHH